MLKTTIRLEMISKLVLAFTGVLYSYGLIRMKNIYSKIGGIILIAVALYWMFNRDYYLPFLGRCAMPSNVIGKPSVVKVDGKVPVKISNLPSNTQIIYWASIPSNEVIGDPKIAYGDYKNSGTTMSNDMGEAFIRIDCPANYTVGMLKYRLTKHVHYRYALPEYPGIYSSVYTAKVEC